MEDRMTAQQLKNSILQMAVQGKLVPQDPNDEPASVLLERIRKEKEQLIKDGKIKKNKKESYIFRGADNLHYEQVGKDVHCIEDELPFEIPDTWQWVKLGYISTYEQTKEKIKANLAEPNLWELNLEDIEKGGRILQKKTVQQCNSKGDKTIFKKGDILYSKLRPYLLKILIADEAGICTSEIVPFHTYNEICSYYVVTVLKSPFIDNYINSVTYGVKMPRAGTDTMVNLFIPLPPVKEQNRIIECIRSLEPLIQKYQKIEEQLYELNSNIKNQLKKSILQYAIEGKLVQQDSNDEPASVLLERIREEKNKLIAEGKIKKDKNESIIYRRDNSYYEKCGSKTLCIDEEIPFEIPNDWGWIRLGKLTYNHGQKKPNCDFCYIDIGSINNKLHKLNENEVVINVDKAPSRARKIVEFGDILYATVRPYLHNMCIMNRNFSLEPIASTGFAVLTCHSNYLNEFLFMYMMSPVFDQYANKNENSRGVAYPAINDSKLRAALIPVPSVLEQHKIIDKYKSLMNILS